MTVCTIYDAVPTLEPPARAALSMFNEVILREAFAHKVTVIDLRLVCADATDYSALSPIEPSATGGARIAERIAAVVTDSWRSDAVSVVVP